MPRKIYYADHTRDEIEAMFSGALGRIGDADVTRRVRELRVNGRRLGDTKPRLHKQYSSHYSKEENESYATATMLAQLDICDRVQQLLERDKPDIQVQMSDGAPVYVEVRLIQNDRIRRSRFVEDLNHALSTLALRDTHLSHALDTLNITLRMSFHGQIAMHHLLKESVAFVKSILTESRENERIPALYPLLHSRGALATWRPKKYKQVNIFQDSLAQFGMGDTLFPEMRAAVDEKLTAGRDYDPACRPLWLLLEVAEIMRPPSGVASDATTLFQGLTDIVPFERIIVTAPGMAPQVFPNQDGESRV